MSFIRVLQTNGDFQTPAAPKPNDLAACQVTPGSEWILAKVLSYDATTGTYKLADEDVESNKGKFALFQDIRIFLCDAVKAVLFRLFSFLPLLLSGRCLASISFTRTTGHSRGCR
jgi:hypothetical protein